MNMVWIPAALNTPVTRPHTPPHDRPALGRRPFEECSPDDGHRAPCRCHVRNLLRACSKESPVSKAHILEPAVKNFTEGAAMNISDGSAKSSEGQ
ncbi:hypothetical protein GCM10009849_36190 [Sinomonas flava]|uniref:Uncharacterized protein n=1 Tax=Sinomonas flava TaxID=496857 RepID=A0ABN3C2N3_9MICC